MAFTIAKKQPPLRDRALPWDAAGPGLYDDGESLVQLDDGNYAAVSVKSTWQEQGHGVAMIGTARWCDQSGQTILTPDNQHVESSFAFGVSPALVALMGEDVYDRVSADVLRVVLGEPPLLHYVGDDGKDIEALVLNSPRETLLQASLREQIRNAQHVMAPKPAHKLLSLKH